MKSIYGTWSVTTEGDVEGRSIKNLGVHTGYIDEIALHFANKCYYSLNFKETELIEEYIPTKSEVMVSFRDEPNVNEMKKLFAESNRPVTIERGNLYNSIKIVALDKDGLEKRIKREIALAKLSEEDKEVLGL